jgi:deoxyribodipyrimidine photolyase
MRKAKRRADQADIEQSVYVDWREQSKAGVLNGQPEPSPSTIIWLRGRGDLRIHDNPLLLHAQRVQQPLIILFTWSQADATGPHSFGDAQRVLMFSVIKEMQRELKERYNQNIYFARICDQGSASNYVELFESLGKAFYAKTLLFARRYEPPLLQLDLDIERELTTAGGWQVFSYNMHLLHEPWAVGYDGNSPATFGHFGTLLPFLRAWERNAGYAPEPCQAPDQLPKAPPKLPWPAPANTREYFPENLQVLTAPFDLVPSLERTGLHPVRPGQLRWDRTLLSSWDVSETAARAQLRRFLENQLPQYENSKSRADREAVSRLSPFLALGVLSVREMFHETRAALRRLPEPKRSKTFARRLIWRDLAYWTLHLFPHATVAPIRSHYAAQQWNNDREALTAWQLGRTGYPIIDAGMRQLWQTGWMPQNIRMAAASFLIEYLNIHWVRGLQWFHETLIDLDIAINAMMWQNAGRTGLDMWNFVIHPVTSAQTSDPTGAYVRKWIPELARLPNPYIHAPWQAPESVLLAAGVKLGTTYPERLVTDLEAARTCSKRAVLEMRIHSEPDFFNSDGYDRIRVPAAASNQERAEPKRETTSYVWRHVFTRREFREAPFSSLQPKHPTGAFPQKR